MNGIEVRPPADAPALVAELRRVAELCDRFWDALPEHVFYAPLGEAWSPADNVRHLILTTGPVATALLLPGFLLRALFGPAERPSAGYLELVATYRGRLSAGGGAGRFAPRPLGRVDDAARHRRRLMARKAAADRALAARAARRSEAALDSCRLPHPLLGKLTLREMLAFTLYHGVHHAGNVQRRLASL